MRRLAVCAVLLSLANFTTGGLRQPVRIRRLLRGRSAAAGSFKACPSRTSNRIGVKVSRSHRREVAVGLSQRSNVRFGFNAFGYGNV